MKERWLACSLKEKMGSNKWNCLETEIYGTQQAHESNDKITCRCFHKEPKLFWAFFWSATSIFNSGKKQMKLLVYDVGQTAQCKKLILQHLSQRLWITSYLCWQYHTADRIQSELTQLQECGCFVSGDRAGSPAITGVAAWSLPSCQTIV